MTTPRNIVIVGAGPAGLGCAIELSRRGVNDFTLLDRHGIGASFERWPAETRFITPSFPASGFGVSDLNQIGDVLPSSIYDVEHPPGRDYARYLQAVTRHHDLTIATGIDVRHVSARPGGGFLLDTSSGPIETHCLIWAAGEFQYPDPVPFPGAEHGITSMRLASYRALKGSSFTVVGGYESGCDVACFFLQQCAKVKIISATDWWNITHHDPSEKLSPVTRQRLAAGLQTGRLDLVHALVINLAKEADGTYTLTTCEGKTIPCATPPILATGFRGSLTLLGEDLLLRDHRGHPRLTEHDESTLAPGLFISGPMVVQGGEKHCFIYKFRTRFSVIAEHILARFTPKGVLA
jgi:putative flavoprotein involved in K+ transport